MKTKINKNKKASALVAVVVAGVIVLILGVGILSITYGARLNAIRMKNEAVSLMAAEAGYENAVFWMTKQQDLLYKLKNDGVYNSQLTFPNSVCDYQVSFGFFAGAKPIYRIYSQGQAGRAERAIHVYLIQATGGWEMGQCRVPTSTSGTTPVYFADNEVIEMPIHINSYRDEYDNDIDIHISGTPTFLRNVSMGESRYSSGGSDKYGSHMSSFTGGIDFLQPANQIIDETAIQNRISTFRDETKIDFIYDGQSLAPDNSVDGAMTAGAIQLEFYFEDGVGKVRVTENCTVVGHQTTTTWDYKIRPGTNASSFDRYDIYAYHYIPTDSSKRTEYQLSETYVTKEIGGHTSEAGGQIYVDGNVIIGGNSTLHNGEQLINGKITIAATGNIWIADSIWLDGPHDASNHNLPALDNTNALGLIAGGVVKVVDPGMTEYSNSNGGSEYSTLDNYNGGLSNPPDSYPGLAYEPIGNGSSDHRYLPDPTVIEAAITVGGGGFGAENVRRGSNGGRKEHTGIQDDLILHGALSEVIRGVVGLIGSDGYVKNYYVDERLLLGIIPGDIWLKNKYIPAPAGWTDYRP